MVAFLFGRDSSVGAPKDPSLCRNEAGERRFTVCLCKFILCPGGGVQSSGLCSLTGSGWTSKVLPLASPPAEAELLTILALQGTFVEHLAPLIS